MPVCLQGQQFGSGRNGDAGLFKKRARRFVNGTRLSSPSLSLPHVLFSSCELLFLSMLLPIDAHTVHSRNYSETPLDVQAIASSSAQVVLRVHR